MQPYCAMHLDFDFRAMILIIEFLAKFQKMTTFDKNFGIREEFDQNKEFFEVEKITKQKLKHLWKKTQKCKKNVWICVFPLPKGDPARRLENWVAWKKAAGLPPAAYRVPRAGNKPD